MHLNKKSDCFAGAERAKAIACLRSRDFFMPPRTQLAQLAAMLMVAAKLAISFSRLLASIEKPNLSRSHTISRWSHEQRRRRRGRTQEFEFGPNSIQLPIRLQWNISSIVHKTNIFHSKEKNTYEMSKWRMSHRFGKAFR